MSDERASLAPIPGAQRPGRQRLGWRSELLLVLLPTGTVLLVLGLVEAFSRQRLLFSSLASSAFLIYLDPEHGTNSVRTLLLSHLVAAGAGLLCFICLGPGYVAGATALGATIVLMLVLDTVHPPAVATSLSFAFRSGAEQNLILFVMALGLIAALIILERATLWLLARLTAKPSK